MTHIASASSLRFMPIAELIEEQVSPLPTELDAGQFRMAAADNAVDTLTFERHVRPLVFWLVHQHAEYCSVRIAMPND